MSNQEIWKDIKGYRGYYRVSNLGRVKSTDRDINYGKGAIIIKKGSVLKAGISDTGYLVVSLWMEGKAKSISVHRLVAKAFIPNPHNKPQVNHKNGVKTNNYIDNLEWCTSSENCIHYHKNKHLNGL